MTIHCAGMLIDFIKETAENHNAVATTPVYVREGPAGPMRQITMVKMMEDGRGLAIILETDAVLLS